MRMKTNLPLILIFLSCVASAQVKSDLVFIASHTTGVMLLAQPVISPQISSDCVCSRSCSNFSKEAIHQFGLVKGIFLTADRLLRCNRGCENDFPPSAFEPNGKIKDEPSDYRR